MPAPAFCIGNVAVRNRVVLAPMSGVTDAPFRRLVARLGAGLVVSEMTASDALVEGRRNAVLRAEGQGTGIHVVQLAGCEPHWMAEGARIAEDAGADIIDINMGCPAKHVANGQSGSALMRDLDHALTLIEATVGAVAVPVTLKMRLGWDDRSINAPELARRAEAAGVRMITVHGRTRCQFYTGTADWAAVRAVKDSDLDPARRQRRHPQLRRRRRGARGIRRRCRHGRPRARRAGRGCRARSRAISRPAGAKPRRRSRRSSRWSPRSTRRCWRITACASGSSMRASISAGRSMPRPRRAGVALDTLKRWRGTVLTSETPADARARLAQAYDAFACGAAA